MNNKPVAWIDKTEGILSFDYIGAGFIPLYTNPVKELTDEEIEEVINRTYWVGTEDEIRLKIARSILRKAQEK